jgi:transposase-like protein
MILVALTCPFCGSVKVGNNEKQRYICKNSEYSRQTFYAEYADNACKSGGNVTKK